MKNLPIKIRPIKSTDHSFIFDAWAKTIQPRYRFVDHRLFRSGINMVMEEALARCEATHGGFVAHDESDEDQILGLQVISVPIDGFAVIEFAYTKSFFWEFGLQTQLFKSITQTTKVVTELFPALSAKEFFHDGKPLMAHLINKYGIVYDPFFLKRVMK